MQLTSIRSSSITSIIFNSATIQWNPGGRNCSLSTPFYQPLEPRNVHSQRGLMIQRRTSHDSPKANTTADGPILDPARSLLLVTRPVHPCAYLTSPDCRTAWVESDRLFLYPHERLASREPNSPRGLASHGFTVRPRSPRRISRRSGSWNRSVV